MTKRTKDQTASLNSAETVRKLMEVVEKLPADTRLTDAVVGLAKAKDSLTRYAEDQPRIEPPAPLNLYEAKKELVAYCEQLGLVWNEGNWEWVSRVMVKEGLTHQQAIEAGKTHITLVAHLFNPAAYKWRGRLLIAAHFVFNFKRPKKPTA